MNSACDIRRGHEQQQGLVGFRVSFADVSVQVELPQARILRGPDQGKSPTTVLRPLILDRERWAGSSGV